LPGQLAVGAAVVAMGTMVIMATVFAVLAILAVTASFADSAWCTPRVLRYFPADKARWRCQTTVSIMCWSVKGVGRVGRDRVADKA